MPKKIAIYPGSFDPITNGHVDIIRRACAIFDEVIVAVLTNRNKTPAFSAQERIELIKHAVKPFKRAKVDSFSGLLVDYMRKRHIKIAIRGLRAVSDLEYEFQMANTNRTLYPEMETVFLMPGSNYAYLTSSMVREIAALGGSMPACVPAEVVKALKKKFKA